MLAKIIKENKYALVILVFLLINLPLAVFLVKVGFRVLLKAAPTVNISGDYSILVSLTSPQVAEGNLIGTLNQDTLGKVTGIVSQPDGSNATQITGAVEGNVFTSNSTRVTVKIKPPDEEIEITVTADLIFTGTMNEAENKMTGTVTGQTVGAKPRSIAGTFAATRTSAFPPSPTPTSTLTPSPTLLPSPTPYSSPTPTPTTPSSPTSTPLPTIPLPTASPTPHPQLPTSTPTLQPTATLPPSLTPLPTLPKSQEPASLNVTYRFPQSTCEEKTEIELEAKATSFKANLIFKNGKIEPVVTNGLLSNRTYDFILEAPMHLTAKKSLFLQQGINYLDFGNLLAGDIAPVGKRDDFVNSLDWGVLVSWWGKEEKTADLNCDGTVNTLDASLMLNNFFKEGTE